MRSRSRSFCKIPVTADGAAFAVQSVPVSHIEGELNSHAENVAANGQYDNGEAIYRDVDDDIVQGVYLGPMPCIRRKR